METYYPSFSSSSTAREAQASGSLLHTVRKPPAKPWSKKSVAPPPTSRTKVYKVDPMDFRDLVQRLTGAPARVQPRPQPQPQPQRLRSLAPAPLNMETEMGGSPLELFPQPSNVKAEKPPESGGAGTSLFGFDLLSPSTFNWYSFLSPGSMSGLEQSTAS